MGAGLIDETQLLAEPVVDRPQLLGVELHRGGQEQRVVAGGIGPQSPRLVRLQVRAEVPGLPALAFEPALRPSAGIGDQPFLADALAVEHHAVLVAHALLHEQDFEATGRRGGVCVEQQGCTGSGLPARDSRAESSTKVRKNSSAFSGLLLPAALAP